VLSKWEKPFLCAFSDEDPITRGADRRFQQLIPGTKGQPHTTIVGGGHFLQEDRGEELARVVVEFIESTEVKA
jgi:haloalkane dehalogenase